MTSNNISTRRPGNLLAGAQVLVKTWSPAKSIAGSLFALLLVLPVFAADAPEMVVVQDMRILKLPDDVTKFLSKEFPKYKIPEEASYNQDMLGFFYRQLLGVHPAVAFGDFNGDKKRDYAFLIETGTTPWGPLMELVVLTGAKKKGNYDMSRLGEVYDAKSDYVSFVNDKLIKGKYQKGAWYINWDKKTNSYVVTKS